MSGPRRNPQPGACSSCGAAILWVETPAGKKMPLDADSGQRRILLGRKTGLAHVYTPHWSTCPSADQHRRRPATADGRSRHVRGRRPPVEHRDSEDLP